MRSPVRYSDRTFDTQETPKSNGIKRSGKEAVQNRRATQRVQAVLTLCGGKRRESLRLRLKDQVERRLRRTTEAREATRGYDLPQPRFSRLGSERHSALLR